MAKHLKVLIIEDEESEIFHLKLIFRENFETLIDITTALKAEDSEKELLKQSFDIVILDNKLPGLHGSEFIPTILKLNPNCIIAAFSDSSVSNEQMLQAGAHKILGKEMLDPSFPIKLRELIAMVA